MDEEAVHAGGSGGVFRRERRARCADDGHIECGDHIKTKQFFFFFFFFFFRSLSLRLLFNRAGIERALTTLSRVYLLSALQVVCSATCSGR